MEKELDDSNNETSDNSSNEEANDTEETGINTFYLKKLMASLKNITRRMWQTMQSSDPAAVVELQQYLKTNRSSWENARDHHLEYYHASLCANWKPLLNGNFT